MKVDHAVTFSLFKHDARAIIEADLQVAEDEAFYFIDSVTIIEIGGFEVEIAVDLADLPEAARKHIEKSFDDYVTENAYELVASQSDYEADAAYDRWKEAHDYE